MTSSDERRPHLPALQVVVPLLAALLAVLLRGAPTGVR